MTHPNETLVRNGYEAFAKGDMQTVNELFSDDIVWHVPGRGQLAGDYKGKDQVFDFFTKLINESGGTFQQEVHDVIANDEHTIVMVTWSAERGGNRFQDRNVHVLHVLGEKVTEFWGYAEDQYGEDQFWG
jgi:uncharacterized protein